MNTCVEKRVDFCVCGGGLAGISAAVTAARNGLKVLLCNDKAVLGGNSSSEFRVWCSGATGLGNNRYADESGIIGEIIQESLYKNPEGNPYLWDAYLLDFVRQENNITLLLNASVESAEVDNGTIRSIVISQHTTEKLFTVYADYYADCTGDGRLGVISGAQWVFGGNDEDYSDKLPFELESKQFTLGSSILFYKKELDHPVPYYPPAFAYRKEEIEKAILETKKIVSLDMNGCDYWWLEFGGTKDTITDSEEIQFELQRIVYGLWDYIKNSGKYPADNYSLEWVGSIPGRRETRRIIAEHTLTTEEICAQTSFEDAVAYGGWPVDVHPSGGFFDPKPSCLQIDIGVYQIPLRCLIAKDLTNLFLAGRDAGLTHGAMASARVMKTCATMGQGIGTAVSLSVKTGLLPKAFTRKEYSFLQQKLLKDDAWLVDVLSTDEKDVARYAALSASGELPFRSDNDDGWLMLDKPVCIVLPPLPENAQIHLPVKHTSAEASVTIEVYGSSKLQNHDLHTLIGKKTYLLSGDSIETITVLEKWAATNTLLRIFSTPEVSIGLSSLELPGVLGVISENAKGLDLFKPAIDVLDYHPFGIANVVDGYNRPLGHMHNWVCKTPADVTLVLNQATNIRELHLYLDTSLSRAYNNLRPDYLNPGASNPEWRKMPENLARTFIVEFVSRAGSRKVTVENNYRRHVLIKTDQHDVERITIHFEQSWGNKLVSVFEVRVYEESTAIC